MIEDQSILEERPNRNKFWEWFVIGLGYTPEDIIREYKASDIAFGWVGEFKRREITQDQLMEKLRQLDSENELLGRLVADHIYDLIGPTA